MNLKNELEEEILHRIDLKENLSEEEIWNLLDEEIRKESKTRRLCIAEREKIRKNCFSSIRQLGILQDLIEDQSITEIMVNGTDAIFIERNGKLSKLEVAFDSAEHLKSVIWQITAECNRVVNEASPIVDARLPDGARVNVVLSPIALNGPILTIRRFPRDPINYEDLLTMGTINHEALEFLCNQVAEGKNILISGGTGTGKTTFLNVLSQFIPPEERVITIEDSAELQLQNTENLVRLETRNQNVDGCREIGIRDLIKTSLRMRPDRIIVGEVRGKEAIDMLQSVNVGHSAMTTVHANSIRDVVSRLETMVLMGMEMPVAAIRKQIEAGFDLMVHLERERDGSRKVKEIAETSGFQNGEVFFHTLFLGEYESGEWVIKKIQNEKKKHTKFPKSI